MIYDTIENLKTYREIPALTKVIDFIQTHNLNELAIGKHVIDGDNVFVNIQEYVTKNPEDTKVESHKSYIDVQIMFDGMEYIGYVKLSECGDPVESRPGEDIWFYDADVQNFEMTNNMCMILFPQDCHQPQVRNGEKQMVHKAVFKVHV